MRVAFLLQDLQLSGGVGVVVEHAAQLRAKHGIDAQLVLTRAPEHPSWPYRGLADVPVLGLDEATAQRWDVAVASWWRTTEALFRLPAERYAYFVQLLEDSTYPAGSPQRLAAAMTTALPVCFITEARWIADLLGDYQPGVPVRYVPNGIAKDVFAGPAEVQRVPGPQPLRVVLEGSHAAVQKGVPDALAAVAAAREPMHVTWVSPVPTADRPAGVHEVHCGLSHAEMASLFAEQHVILKLSRAEGMYGPPLEAFHMGATVVTTPVTGHDEYIEHDVNGLVIGFDDVDGTARALDLLARDHDLLHRLRCGALQTARAWPGWDQASAVMADALRAIAAEPRPDVRGAGMRLTSDFASMLSDAEQATRAAESERARIETLQGQRAVRFALRLRRGLDTVRRRGR